MLAIRLQRLGRKGYPVYRVAVQEAQRGRLMGGVVLLVLLLGRLGILYGPGVANGLRA